MIRKPARCSFFWIVLLTFLIACGKQIVVIPTETAIPTVVSPHPIATATLIPVTITPSPLPTKPIIPLIMPDAIQVERWKDYENALAEVFFNYLKPEDVVCEWEILGRNEQEVYVYALCAGIYLADPSQASIPAVIHIGTDGSVQSAEIPGAGTAYGADIRRMFPSYAQERIFIQPIDYIGSDAYWRAIERADRLRWRRGHPDEPPWIVLNSLPIQPTQLVIPWVTPDPIQVEQWKEYQTALADKFSYLPPEEVICEWEILGRTDNEIYVWAVCGKIRDIRVGLEGLAIIHVGDDGSVQNATTSSPGGFSFPSEIRATFPLDVQEKYFDGSIHFQELVNHLRWRQQIHREEPPLIVSNTTPTP